MRKKHLTLMTMAFFVAITMTLQAQDNPNGGMIPGGASTTDPQHWYRTGNTQLSGTVNNMLGFTNATPIRFCTKNENRMFIDTLGMIGINTTAPLQRLHVLDGNILISRSVSDELGSANGTIYFGDVVEPNEPYGKWGIEYVSSQQEGYGLNFWKPWVTGQHGGNFYLFLADTGNVGIGTNHPQAKLAVNGDVLAKEVRVSVAATDWPDYVFSPDFKMISLGELEKYIQIHRHLPGVLSASEVENAGDIDLGEMTIILLQKIEEMTLRMIEMEKKIDAMKQKQNN